MIGYRYDSEGFDDRKYICAGNCALARAGLTTFNATYLILYTLVPEYHNKSFGICSFVYSPREMDYEHHLTPAVNNPNILQPDKQRAIVDAILDLDCVDEGILIESLKEYMQYESLDELYAVADEFGLERSKLDYWLQEAREDYDD